MKLLFPATLMILAFVAWAWAQPFSSLDLRVNGRVITVIPADFNGNRRLDLVVISKVGTFPNEKRWVSVFWQQEMGRFNLHPDLMWEMDPEATLIDSGSLGIDAGHRSIVYLAGSEVRAYHLKGETPPTPETLLRIPTFTVFPQPGELPSWTLIHDWKGSGQAWLGVPQFGKLVLYPMGVDGPTSASEIVHIYQPTLAFSGDSGNRILRDYALQLVYRMPQLFVRDFDGDGRVDLIAAWQDNVAVYLQDASGRYPSNPSKTFHLEARTEREKSLRSIVVSPLIEDLNGDGRADLLLIKMTGRLTDRRIAAMVYLNQEGLLPPHPDARVQHEGFGTALLVKDLNGDGKQDLIFPLVKIGVKNLIKNLLSNRVDIELFAHLYRDREIYREAPDWTRDFTYQIDMSDGIMLAGAWPHIGGDFDGDRKADLLVVGNGELAVYLATPGGFFAREPITRLPVKTSPHLLVTDVSGNHHADLLLWYEGEPEWSGAIKVFMNTGKGWSRK